MNLIFYFDQPILPHAGGTERAAYLLAQALSRHGHRVSFLSLQQADAPPGELPYFTLPRQDTLFCRENREYVENLCSAQKTDGLINCGANQDDSFFFSHEHLDIQASIISWISFDVRTGLDYFPSLLRKDFSTWGNTIKTLLRHALLPYKKHAAVSNKRRKYRDMFRGSDKVVFLSRHYTEDALQFEGVQEPAPYYRKARILCLTSTHEGMPMVINEALSYGCVPVVFNSFHAAEDMLPDRETGRLIPPFSLRLFAREMDELMSGPYVPPSTRVLTNYQPEKVIPLWMECLQDQP